MSFQVPSSIIHTRQTKNFEEKKTKGNDCSPESQEVPGKELTSSAHSFPEEKLTEEKTDRHLGTGQKKSSWGFYIIWA